jgi:predicted small lipoprotein YifL
LAIALSALAACGREGPLVSGLASPSPTATTYETPFPTESPAATESPEATETATPEASETPEATAATSQPSGRSGIYGSVTTTCPSTQTTTPCPEEPVAGAEVTAKDESGKVAGTARTDAQGKFEMALSPGTYEVTANAAGCTKERAEVTGGHYTPVHVDCYGVD